MCIYITNIGTCKLGSYSALMQRVGNYCNLYQGIDAEKGLAYWKGKTVTFSCWVLASVANTTRLHVEDGVGSTYSAHHTGDSTWQLITVTHTISNSAAYFAVMCDIETTDTGSYFDGAMCVEGSYAMAYAPSWKNTVRKMVIGPVAFNPGVSTDAYMIPYDSYLQNNAVTLNIYYANVSLPNGAIIIGLTVNYYRSDAAASGSVILQHHNAAGTGVDMATVTYAGAGGYNTTSQTSITDATVDNGTYSYLLRLSLANNAASDDVRFVSAIIKYIAPSPLP